jgi:HD superfamily phosphohydrolase
VILRDPVHGLVEFEGEDEALVLALLGTAEVQRLRRVRQLGLTSLVFPGAEHSRFAHALGAAHVMTRLLERVRRLEDELPAELRLDGQRRRDALAAALLHDLGHGPYSHLFEEVLPNARAHEAWTVAILLDPATEVHRALEAFDPGMAARVASLVTGESEVGWLSRAVSGTLDVDRCDYLLRDSHMTGVAYGIYDLDWLLRALTFAELPFGASASERWVLAIEGRKGLPPIEGFFLARHFMYQQVYHHKATRAAECVVRAIFRRIAALSLDGARPALLPEAIAQAVAGVEPELGRYLELDDATLAFCLAEWERHAEPTLADLAARLRARRLPKTVPLPEGSSEPLWKECEARTREIARSHGLDPDLHVHLDVAYDLPYDEPEGEVSEGLWVTLRHRPIVRLGEVSFALEKLRNQSIVRPRLIFPDELREPVRAALEDLLS